MTEQEKDDLKDAVIAELKSQGTDVSTATVITDAEGISYVICYDTYGNIARVDLKTLNEKSGIDMSWDSNLNLDDIIVEGVYNIKGNRLNSDKDNLPFDNTGENASFAARLIVTTSPEGATVYRHIVGQTLIIANAEGHETKVYTRSGNRTSYDGGISYVTTWGIWSTLQRNVNVGEVISLDDLIDNGIYSGVLTGTGETFVLVVINNYAVVGNNLPKSISQFKYSVGPFGVISFGKRVKIGNADFPAEWDILNQKEINSMIEAAVRSAANYTDTAVANALQYNTLGVNVYADKAEIYGRSIDSKIRTFDFPAATTKKAGVMSAADKEKLDNLSQGGGGDITALRSLFVAAGAEYNDTDQIIQKTAPWETEEKWRLEDDGTYTYWEEPAIVEHLPKHYYLNGLGDITEEQMMTIYIETLPMTKQPEWINSIRGATVRTNLFPKLLYAAQILKKIDGAFYNTKIEVIRTCYTDNVTTTLSQGFLLNECSVKYIYGVWDVKSFINLLSYAVNNTNLRQIKIKNLKGNATIFNKSQHIYKRSILYAIQNANPTTAITITLHADAYARIANQPDIVAALAAQPLITLVSA